MTKSKIFLLLFMSSIWSFEAMGQCGGLVQGNNTAGPITVTGNCTIAGGIVRIRTQVIVQNGASLTISGGNNLRLDRTNSRLTVQSGGSLTVTGNLQLNHQNAVVTIDAGGTATIDDGNNGNNNNNITGSNPGGQLVVNGTMTVARNATTRNNVTIGSSAQFNVGRNWVAQLGTVDISGDVNVTNNFHGFVVDPGITLNIQSGGNLTAGNNVDIDTPNQVNVSGVIKAGNNARLSQNFSVNNGGIIQVGNFLEAETFNIALGGTLAVDNPGTIATNGINITVNGGNSDLECNNGCCGSLCNVAGTALNAVGAGIVLPIELGHFTGSTRHDFIHLEWSSITEKNNDYYSILKSTDGNAFTELERVNGAGNSDQTRFYSISDYDIPNYGIYYYKLTQTDYDGTTEVLKTIAVACKGSEHEPTVSIYPSLVSQGMSVQLSMGSGAIERGEIGLYDTTGQLLQSQLVTEGTRNVSINTSQLPMGLYYLKGQLNGLTFIQRIIIQ